jgi:hypothetical protein
VKPLNAGPLYVVNLADDDVIPLVSENGFGE